jgi:hypothetical protein
MATVTTLKSKAARNTAQSITGSADQRREPVTSSRRRHRDKSNPGHASPDPMLQPARQPAGNRETSEPGCCLAIWLCRATEQPCLLFDNGRSAPQRTGQPNRPPKTARCGAANGTAAERPWHEGCTDRNMPFHEYATQDDTRSSSTQSAAEADSARATRQDEPCTGEPPEESRGAEAGKRGDSIPTSVSATSFGSFR